MLHKRQIEREKSIAFSKLTADVSLDEDLLDETSVERMNEEDCEKCRKLVITKYFILLNKVRVIITKFLWKVW